MNSMEIRKKFFDFFEKRGHTKVPSSSLIPAQDPTLLFTNAGMNQFKDVFLGKEKRSYLRAISIQKCMRAGGKHNDLDNVGLTNRHLTFFEMMGNFSFGDYFKKDAIKWAWECLIESFGFNPEKMYVTVFHEDDESYQIWQQEIGLSPDRIFKLGAEDNFWQMGDTGPCGPCSEIFFDRGSDVGCRKKSCQPGCSCDRYLEIWNLVFMQYNRQEDGTDFPLEQKGVDTGMGIERLALVVENKESVFETDLFLPIIKKIEELTGHSYYNAQAFIKTAFNVIADHVRASTFLIADGVTPSNEGRGYVLRKVIRRAALFSQKLTEKNIFPELAHTVIDKMSPIYPELKPAEKSIKYLLKTEIDKFAANLIQGQNILEKYFDQSKNKTITGKQAFKLYDTFGFPLELTRVIAHEKGFTVDTKEFDKEMELQRERSGGKITKEEIEKIELSNEIKTEFTGYQEIETTSPVIAIIDENNKQVNTIAAEKECWIITEKTPFFVEIGGQVSDEGVVIIDQKEAPVENLKRINKAIALKITAPVEINLGNMITSKISRQRRLDTMNNHTATHLLQSALIEVLGKEVKQSGSLVHPDYLRFDFTYHKTMTSEEIKKVEDRVNEKIRENLPVNIYSTTYKDAIDKGVIAIFGEKYNPEKVRVIDISPFSMELCGGTHVSQTGDIGAFKITEETSLSAGQRRIFAVTGRGAIELFQQDFDSVKKLSQDFKVPDHELVSVVEKQREQFKEALLTIKKLKKEAWKTQIPQWLQQVKEVNNYPFGFISLKDSGIDELRDITQNLMQQRPGFYFLISCQENNCIFFSSLSDKFENKIDFKAFATWLKDEYSLRGGGKKNSLQGGGPYVNSKDLEEKITAWLQ